MLTLGDIVLQSGDVAGARASYERALAVFTELGVPHVRLAEERLGALPPPVG